MLCHITTQIKPGLTHFSTLAWKIPWKEEPGRLQSMGSLRVGHDWSDLAAAARRGSWAMGRWWKWSWEQPPCLPFQCFKYCCCSRTQSCPTLCKPMNHSTPGLPVHHQLPEFTQTYVHRVGDAIQTSHPLSSPSPAPNPSQHQGFFQWVNS